MSNRLYDTARAAFLTAAVNFASDNIKAVLVDAGYVANLVSDQFLSTIAAPSRIATSGNLASKTTALGVADAADVTFTAVTSTTAITAAVVYKDTGTAATSQLIAYIDTAAGLPVWPSGGDITLAWSNGTDKIFRL